MGAILDVVYNHTAKVDIFEDLGQTTTTLWMLTEHLELALVVDVWDNSPYDQTPLVGYQISSWYLQSGWISASIWWETSAASIGKTQAARPQSKPNHAGWRLENLCWWWKYACKLLIKIGWNMILSLSSQMTSITTSNLIYPNEGQPAFITGGKRDVAYHLQKIWLLNQPTLEADSPGDVINTSQPMTTWPSLTLSLSLLKRPKQGRELCTNPPSFAT